MTDNILERLEEALKKHDWFYHYSDDHRAWTKGTNEWREITALRDAAEDKEAADALIKRYAK